MSPAAAACISRSTYARSVPASSREAPTRGRAGPVRARSRRARVVEAGRRRRGPAGLAVHGVVVDSVKVSVLLYAPVRSAWWAPIDCLNLPVTASLEVGADHVFSVAGVAATGANAPATAACSACG